ncbi:unnamed protein product [Caenorhabditis auriculariae]|uniref:Uncharacterized protein n=1 Tax=Caenorhabditis auriculariae TaxID=2777116 RepID=A0A8S1HPD4_9PELO|nr:unnamed protein product [Caenorhabditis auriculariae]
MGKRRANSETESPIKKQNHSDDEANGVHDEEEVEDKIDVTIQPDSMLLYLEKFVPFLKETKKKYYVKQIDKAVIDWIASCDDIKNLPSDPTEFVKDFKKYLKTSVRVAKLELLDAFHVTKSHLERVESLNSFSDYPARPPTLRWLYTEKTNMSKAIPDVQHVLEAMKNDTSGLVEQCKEEIVEIETARVAELENFLKNHENLSNEQRNHVTNSIKSLRKKLRGPATPRAKTTKAKSKKVDLSAMTAFELFCQSKDNSEKYIDLPEEKRLKKLRKKYDKLSDEARNVYEGLAL